MEESEEYLSKRIKHSKEDYLLSVLLVVAVGDFGKRPHMTASADSLYLFRTFEFEMPLGPKKLTLDSRTCSQILWLLSYLKAMYLLI